MESSTYLLGVLPATLEFRIWLRQLGRKRWDWVWDRRRLKTRQGRATETRVEDVKPQRHGYPDNILTVGLIVLGSVGLVYPCFTDFQPGPSVSAGGPGDTDPKGADFGKQDPEGGQQLQDTWLK